MRLCLIVLIVFGLSCFWFLNVCRFVCIVVFNI